MTLAEFQQWARQRLFSQRKAALLHLQVRVTERLRMDLDGYVAWPDVLLYITDDDFEAARNMIESRRGNSAG